MQKMKQIKEGRFQEIIVLRKVLNHYGATVHGGQFKGFCIFCQEIAHILRNKHDAIAFI